jgi:hypothetical protein
MGIAHRLSYSGGRDGRLFLQDGLNRYFTVDFLMGATAVKIFPEANRQSSDPGNEN